MYEMEACVSNGSWIDMRQNKADVCELSEGFGDYFNLCRCSHPAASSHRPLAPPTDAPHHLHKSHCPQSPCDHWTNCDSSNNVVVNSNHTIHPSQRLLLYNRIQETMERTCEKDHHTNSEESKTCTCGTPQEKVKVRWRSSGFWEYFNRRKPSAWYIFLIFILSISGRVTDVTAASETPAGLSGTIQQCDDEGSVWSLPGVLHDPCYSCLCRGGEVQCERQSCPSLQGCFLIVPGLKEGCCDVCKGCSVGNQTFPSGREITENCMTTSCIAGVLTRSAVQCHVPCTNPVPPQNGNCCPTCNSCSINGREYRHGEEAILHGDPCVRCKCDLGSVSCTKKACPVLACPPSATYIEKGDCCPKCNGSSARYIPRTVCLLGDKVYPTGTTFRLDTCTNCTCSGTTAICDRTSCPALECDPVYQVMTPGSCCPKCLEPENNGFNRSQCQWKETLYKTGDRWNADSCRSCMCTSGKIRCTEQLCPKNVICPWGHKLRYKPGQCCPECVGEDGVCTVFGDPHYSSFDGRVFNFQGACKYMLTSDCKGKTFSVRVRNDARESRAFSWTRTVTLKVKEGRVTLGQKMRIKFNGKRVSLPFSSGTLKIEQDGYTAAVSTGVGIKLLWDGDSFLEVAVPFRLQGKLCGLCGNFNGNQSDDFVTRRGGPVAHPMAFGQSWRVGGKKACSRPEEVKGPDPLCKKSWRLRQKAEKFCNAIRSHVFSPCARSVSPERFFKSCKLDMCECPPERQCHCEVLTAYARACQRAGIEILDWREQTGCTAKKKWQHA